MLVVSWPFNVQEVIVKTRYLVRDQIYIVGSQAQHIKSNIIKA